MFGADFLHDPYPEFRRLRRDAPVSRLGAAGPWLVARHADVVAVLKNGELFRSSRGAREPAPASPDFLLRTRGLVGMDAPEHAGLRAGVKDAFLAPRVRGLEEPIRARARELIRVLALQEKFDLVAGLAKPFPMEVVSMLLGLDVSCARQFQRWAEILVTWGSEECPVSDAEGAGVASEIRDFFSRELSLRRAGEGADLISFLARSGGGQEQVVFLRLLLVAASETTTHLISNTALALLGESGLWERVRRDRSRIPDLIEESLRFDGPVPSLIRWASGDTHVGGVAIRKGEAVMPLLASANHDETVFPLPERFDLDRPARPHLSFGSGAHFCLGTVLARMQVRIVFEELLAAFSRIERADGAPIERVESFFVRGPTRLLIKGARDA